MSSHLLLQAMGRFLLARSSFFDDGGDGDGKLVMVVVMESDEGVSVVDMQQWC